MAGVLKQTTLLLRNDPAGPVVAVLAGQEIPDWAVPLLRGKDHLFTVASEPDTGVTKASGPLPAPPAPVVREEDEPKVPSRKAGAPTWKSFAKKIGVEVASKATRDEVIEAILAARPDIEIPEEQE